LVANTSWYLFNFRKSLAIALKGAGYEVVFVSPRDQYSERLLEGGFRWIELKISRRNTFFLKELVTLLSLARIYRAEQPVAVHHFTVKCVLYGTVAAYMNQVPAVINSITGLGHLFIDRNFKTRFLRQLVQYAYRWALKADRCFVIFQNPDDYDLFASKRMINPSRAIIIRGSGVDTERFKPKTGENAENSPTSEPMILFASRLTREKGISELLEGFDLLQKRGRTASLVLAGSPDPLIAQSTIVVLPSYREGTPRILLEAAAMAKPIVATDVPGCREIIENGKNGLLVPAKNAGAIADAFETLLDSQELRESLGGAARQKVVDEFDTRTVISATLKIYRKMMCNR
jgi:glycosyltransferase involved in cell wall biosynthesis